MKIQWAKVTWYSKLIAAVLFILLPLAGFYAGIWYQKSISTVPRTQEAQTQNQQKSASTTPETERTKTPEQLEKEDGSKKTICRGIIEVFISPQKYNVSVGQAKDYFAKNGLGIVNETENKFILDIGTGDESYWVEKIKNDGIADASFIVTDCIDI